MSGVALGGFHISRTWDGADEYDCACPRAACGYVISLTAVCEQHGVSVAKTMRSIHVEDRCPAATSPQGSTPDRAGKERDDD